MKKKLLALAIPALVFSGFSHASVEVWNQDGSKVSLDGHLKAANRMSKDHDERGDNSEARLGVNAESQIYNDMTGYGRLEWQTDSTKNDGEKWDLSTRYAFAGLNFGAFGSIDYGRNDGLLKGVSAYTDVLPDFGGDSSNYYLLSNRTSGVATYRNNAIDGLSLAVQYADADRQEHKDGDKTYTYTRGESYAVSAEYTLLDTGLSAIVAYAGAGDNNQNSVAAGLKYDNDSLFLATTYFHGMDKALLPAIAGMEGKITGEGFEAVAGYSFDFGLTPTVAYVQHKLKSGDISAYLDKYVSLGAKYQFNQNISAIAEYKINLIKDDGPESKSGLISTKDVVGLGLVYDF